MSVSRMARIALTGSLSIAAVGIFSTPAHASVGDGGFRLIIAAGNGGSGSPVPGPATSTATGSDVGVAFDRAGNMYIADYTGYEVLKVTTAGQLSVFAGNGGNGAPTAGLATGTSLGGHPTGLGADAAGNVYIASDGDYVSKVTPAGQLSVFAGNGSNGTPVEGAAIDSPLGRLYGSLAVNAAGDVFIPNDQGYVEKVTQAGHLSIFAGNSGGSGGNGMVPKSGYPATRSQLDPQAVATDAAGNVYIADYDGYVEKVTPAGILTVVAGNGGTGRPLPGPAIQSPMYPGGVAVDRSGDIYIVDWNYGTIDKITARGTMSVIAGDGGWGTPVPGPARETDMYPDGVAVSPSGFLYEADDNGYVMKVVGSFTAGSLPRVSGIRRVGKTLRVSNARTTVTPSRVSYQWLRNGRAIRGATHSSYKLTRLDRGKTIKVKVTYSAPDYISRSQTVTAARRVG